MRGVLARVLVTVDKRPPPSTRSVAPPTPAHTSLQPPNVAHGCCPFVLFLSFAASSPLHGLFRMSLSLLSHRVSVSCNLGSPWHRGYLLTPTLQPLDLPPPYSAVSYDTLERRAHLHNGATIVPLTRIHGSLPILRVGMFSRSRSIPTTGDFLMRLGIHQPAAAATVSRLPRRLLGCSCAR